MKPNNDNSHKIKCNKQLTPAQVTRRRNKRQKEAQLDSDINHAVWKDMFGEK